MTVEPSTLQLLWFGLVAVLWIGFLVLEGFDFGVGMLIPFLGRDDKEKRVLFNTIGPVLDGNEVWLITAAGAMFAAFPGWYATLFSGLYLPFFLVLVGLIVRGLAVHYRGKRSDATWKQRWDWSAATGSLLVTVVLGVAFSNFLIGLPVVVPDGRQGVHVVTTGFFGLFSPFALLGAVVLIGLFLFHGSVFLALKTRGEIHDRANGFARKIGLAVLAAGFIWALWGNLAYGTGASGWLLMVVAGAGIGLAWFMVRLDRDGWAFVGTAVTTAVVTLSVFLSMYPDLGFDNSSASAPLNILSASASPMTLTIMTWTALVFVPLVLAYQAWTYWVFRRRLSTKNIPDDTHEPQTAG